MIFHLRLLTATIEFLLVGGVDGGSEVICKVLFISNPTTVEVEVGLCWSWVGVLAIVLGHNVLVSESRMIQDNIFNQKILGLKFLLLCLCLLEKLAHPLTLTWKDNWWILIMQIRLMLLSHHQLTLILKRCDWLCHHTKKSHRNIFISDV